MDVVAPGQQLWGVDRYDQTLSGLQGTSYAAPLVSGSLALLWSLIPAAPRSDILQLATSTAVDYPLSSPNGFDQLYGWGRFDAEAAYQAMIAMYPVQTDVALSATTPRGFETTLSWSAAPGSGVFYRYGFVGGPEYETTATSGRLLLSEDGTHTVYIHEFASDRWANNSAVTVELNVSTGLAALESLRMQGADRYRTSAATSRQSFPATAPAVVVASGENWPDALGAGVLAAKLGGPVLLTPASSLSVATRDEILRLNPSTIVIVGGPSAVSSQVRAALAALPLGASVQRVYGMNRYETATAIARRIATESGGPLPSQRVIVASGEKFADALSVGPLAAKEGYPVLLAGSAWMPSTTRETITALAVTSTIIVGGKAVLPDAVVGSLPSPIRLAGSDRYATSRAIADFAILSGSLDEHTLGVATGASFPDALTAASLMRARSGAVLLTNGVPPAFGVWLGARGENVRQLLIFGGPAAVSYDTEFDIKNALRGQ